MKLSPVIPVQGRPGFFAVLSDDAASTITLGHMKLFWSETHGVVVETITRSRKPLSHLDNQYRVVFFALDQENRLVINSS